MKKLVSAAAALTLSGCMTPGSISLPAAGSGAAAASASAALGGLHEFLTDPNCSHDDEATFVTGAGGLPASFQAKVARHCQARPFNAGAPAGPASLAH